MNVWWIIFLVVVCGMAFGFGYDAGRVRERRDARERKQR